MLARQKTAIITVAVGSAINFALATTKLYIGLRSNSISILSDSVNNYLDIVTCIIAIFAFIMAGKISKRYPFGAGRAEYIAGFIVSVVVCIVGANFIFAAATRLMMPVPVWFSWLYFVIIAVTAVIKLLMAEFYRRINLKINSDAIRALMLDSYIDAAITTMVLIGFMLVEYSGLRLDGIFGIITGVILLSAGIRLMIINTRSLIGEGVSEKEQKQVEDIFAAYNNIQLIKLQLHNYGHKKTYGIAEVKYSSGLDLSAVKQLNTIIEERIKKVLEIDIKITFGR